MDILPDPSAFDLPIVGAESPQAGSARLPSLDASLSPNPISHLSDSFSENTRAAAVSSAEGFLVRACKQVLADYEVPPEIKLVHAENVVAAVYDGIYFTRFLEKVTFQPALREPSVEALVALFCGGDCGHNPRYIALALSKLNSDGENLMRPAVEGEDVTERVRAQLGTVLSAKTSLERVEFMFVLAVFTDMLAMSGALRFCGQPPLVRPSNSGGQAAGASKLLRLLCSEFYPDYGTPLRNLQFVLPAMEHRHHGTVQRIALTYAGYSQNSDALAPVGHSNGAPLGTLSSSSARSVWTTLCDGSGLELLGAALGAFDESLLCEEALVFPTTIRYRSENNQRLARRLRASASWAHLPGELLEEQAERVAAGDQLPTAGVTASLLCMSPLLSLQELDPAPDTSAQAVAAGQTAIEDALAASAARLVTEDEAVPEGVFPRLLRLLAPLSRICSLPRAPTAADFLGDCGYFGPFRDGALVALTTALAAPLVTGDTDGLEDALQQLQTRGAFSEPPQLPSDEEVASGSDYEAHRERAFAVIVWLEQLNAQFAAAADANRRIFEQSAERLRVSLPGGGRSLLHTMLGRGASIYSDSLESPAVALAVCSHLLCLSSLAVSRVGESALEAVWGNSVLQGKLIEARPAPDYDELRRRAYNILDLTLHCEIRDSEKAAREQNLRAMGAAWQREQEWRAREEQRERELAEMLQAGLHSSMASPTTDTSLLLSAPPLTPAIELEPEPVASELDAIDAIINTEPAEASLPPEPEPELELAPEPVAPPAPPEPPRHLYVCDLPRVPLLGSENRWRVEVVDGILSSLSTLVQRAIAESASQITAQSELPLAERTAVTVDERLRSQLKGNISNLAGVLSADIGAAELSVLRARVALRKGARVVTTLCMGIEYMSQFREHSDPPEIISGSLDVLSLLAESPAGAEILSMDDSFRIEELANDISSQILEAEENDQDQLLSRISVAMVQYRLGTASNTWVHPLSVVAYCRLIAQSQLKDQGTRQLWVAVNDSIVRLLHTLITTDHDRFTARLSGQECIRRVIPRTVSGDTEPLLADVRQALHIEAPKAPISSIASRLRAEALSA